MSDFRTRLLGLAAVATAFAGLSYGQTFQCGYNGVLGTLGTGLGYAANGLGYAPTQVRVSATNDLVTDLVFTCGAGSASSTGALTVSIPGVSQITSRTGSTNEATLVITTVTNAGPNPPVPPFTGLGTNTGSSSYSGTVVGNSVVFTGVTFPASAYVVEIANIRINATGLSAGTFIQESASITNLGLVEFSATQPITVGETFSDFTFSAPSFGGPYPICVASDGQTFSVTVTEKFGAAFKAAIPGGITTSNAPLDGTCGGVNCDMANGNAGSWAPDDETPWLGFTSLINTAYHTPGIGNGVGQATHGTRFAVTFANMNSGVSISLPTTITYGSYLTAYMTANATGAFSFVTGPNYTVPQNGTVYYEIAYADDSQQTLPLTITGTWSWAANFSPNPVTAPTVSVTLDPAQTVNPATNDIPNFVATPNPQPLSTWILCNTTLLFPYVANGGGFDTGIVFSNTSTDPLTTIGAGTAANEQGSCSMWFYGSGAPSTQPVVATTANANNIQLTATDNAFTLSSVAPGFSGYMIAICNYQYGHGFAYITYDLTQSQGAAMGYLALVLPTTGHGARPVQGAGTEDLNN